jgi:hypothetical protein
MWAGRVQSMVAGCTMGNRTRHKLWLVARLETLFVVAIVCLLFCFKKETAASLMSVVFLNNNRSFLLSFHLFVIVDVGTERTASPMSMPFLTRAHIGSEV